MCRFYLLLAGAVGKRQGIAIPYPSPTPLLTPGGNPLRRGISAAAVDRDLVSLYPVAGRSSPLRRGVWGNCVRAWTVRVSVDFAGLMSFVFHWWWEGLFVPAAT